MKKNGNANMFLQSIIILLTIAVITTVVYNLFVDRDKESSNKELNILNVQKSPISKNNDTNWNLILVNKWNKIPENYNVDLVEVPGGEKVDKRIYEPLMKMLEDAKKSNLGRYPLIVSGYRTDEKQKELYNRKISEYRKKGYSKEKAKKEAEMWVAVPGYSEHQLGFAVDINGETYDIYLWLRSNSYKYGFIFRYPGDKTEITGTAEEVWHYRYVGIEVATYIYENDICLEEYLKIKNN